VEDRLLGLRAQTSQKRVGVLEMLDNVDDQDEVVALLRPFNRVADGEAETVALPSPGQLDGLG